MELPSFLNCSFIKVIQQMIAKINLFMPTVNLLFFLFYEIGSDIFNFKNIGFVRLS